LVKIATASSASCNPGKLTGSLWVVSLVKNFQVKLRLSPADPLKLWVKAEPFTAPKIALRG